MGLRLESSRGFRRLALAASLAVSGAAPLGGCSIVLETEAQNCRTDADCARHPNAVCDSARKLCVTRQPTTGSLDADSGIGDGGPDDAGGGLACELSFDNRARIRVSGPDGGLRPLPEAP